MSFFPPSGHCIHETKRLTFTFFPQTCISTLAIRNMVRPFKDGMLQQACPMADILGEVASQLGELKALRRQADFDMAPA